jgi:hypothetical protein
MNRTCSGADRILEELLSISVQKSSSASKFTSLASFESSDGFGAPLFWKVFYRRKTEIHRIEAESKTRESKKEAEHGVRLDISNKQHPQQ